MPYFNFAPIIPTGEIILVTGVNGYIGAHVADQALGAGYRVRGTVRNVEKGKWAQELFDKKYGKGKFELIKLENFNNESDWDDAVNGVSGVAHVALDTNLSGEPEPYISTTLASTRATLNSAKKEPKVKRVVLTSSTMGAVQPNPNVEFTFGPDAYNEDAIKKAYELPFTPDKMMTVYAASKALSEKEAFKWVAEEKPHFGLNIVVPAANMGKSLSGEWQSTGAWAKMVFEGDYSWLQYVPPQYFVDVVDTARLHLGALIHPEVEGERLFGMAAPYNWNTILEILKKIYPTRQFPEAPKGLGHDLSHPPTEKAVFLLKSLGVDGFKSLEQSLRENLEGFP